MLCEFLVYSKVIQLYTYIHFLTFFSTMVYYRILNIVPWAILLDLVVGGGFFAVPRGIWDLSFLTRDGSCKLLHWKHRVLSTRLAGKSPECLLMLQFWFVSTFWV